MYYLLLSAGELCCNKQSTMTLAQKLSLSLSFFLPLSGSLSLSSFARSLFVHLSFSVSIFFLSVSLCLYLSVCLSVCVSLPLSPPLSISPSLSPALYLSISLPLSISTFHPFAPLHITLSNDLHLVLFSLTHSKS